LAYYLTLKAENVRRDRGLADEIIDGVNDKGMPICCCGWSRYRLIYFCGVGDPETVEKLSKLNGRFATVEDAKKEKGDRWSGYRYIL
jgi:hypothetical protein